MAKIYLPTEQRTHEWDDNDPRLKDDTALREFFGALAGQYRTAEIVRKQNGDTLEITITPRMGQKGSDEVLHMLLSAPEEIHPALLLAWQLEGGLHRDTLEIGERLERYQAIEAMIEEAETGQETYRTQIALLQASPPAPARDVPLGF